MRVELPRPAPKKNGKLIELDFEENFIKPPSCPKCGNKDFEGFSTGYGPYRRCKDIKCRYEWPCGGMSEMIMMPKEAKEAMRDFTSARAQDEAYNKVLSIQEDYTRLEDLKSEERLSGSSVNRNFWNSYIGQWDED